MEEFKTFNNTVIINNIGQQQKQTIKIVFNPSHPSVAFHIETSHSFVFALQNKLLVSV